MQKSVETIEDIIKSGKLDFETIMRIRTAQAKYTEQWWLSNDPYVRAFYQLHERIILVDYSQFCDDVMLLIGRDFQRPLELMSSALLKESEERFAEYRKNGRLDPLPKNLSVERENAGVDFVMEKWTEHHPKDSIIMVTPPEYTAEDKNALRLTGKTHSELADEKNAK